MNDQESKGPVVSLFDPQTNQLIAKSSKPSEIESQLSQLQLESPDTRQPLFLVVYANGYRTFVRRKDLKDAHQLYEKFKDSIFPKPEFPLTIMQVVGDELNTVMADMLEPWRYRWCESGACGCMGCGNRSGRLSALGFEKEEWEQWVIRNPNPTPARDADAEQKALEKALRDIFEQ